MVSPRPPAAECFRRNPLPNRGGKYTGRFGQLRSAGAAALSKALMSLLKALQTAAPRPAALPPRRGFRGVLNGSCRAVGGRVHGSSKTG